MPSFLVGTTVGGKPNFVTVAWGGIACGDPPMISLAIRQTRHSMKGINENRVFSVNVPSTDQVKETDYCGLHSGSRVDKAAACGFKLFYGKLPQAPLIEQCPVNLECTVVEILELGSHFLVIGNIEEVFISDDCLTTGRPDVAKIKPLVYTTVSSNYQALGEVIGKAFHVGKELG